jgi:hypothetical protein
MSVRIALGGEPLPRRLRSGSGDHRLAISTSSALGPGCPAVLDPVGFLLEPTGSEDLPAAD